MEEALDLSFDRLLMMMMMIIHIYIYIMHRRVSIAVEDDFLILHDRKFFLIISVVTVLGVLCKSWNLVLTSRYTVMEFGIPHATLRNL